MTLALLTIILFDTSNSDNYYDRLVIKTVIFSKHFGKICTFITNYIFSFWTSLIWFYSNHPDSKFRDIMIPPW